jgi:hypothetical protein
MKSQVLLHRAVGTRPGRGHRRFEGRGWSGGEHYIYIYVYIYICIVCIHVCICIYIYIGRFTRVFSIWLSWVTVVHASHFLAYCSFENLGSKPFSRNDRPACDGKFVEKDVENPWLLWKFIYNWWVFHIELLVYNLPRWSSLVEHLAVWQLCQSIPD